MSGLSISLVRSWRPEALSSSAADLGRASSVVDDQVDQLRRSLERMLEDAGGHWAQAAGERAAEEVRTGVRLADALDTARRVLRDGAGEIGAARTTLMAQMDAARGEGFVVDDDGRVTAPTLPPVMSAPDDAAVALASRDARQRSLDERAQQVADGISSGLASVAAADAATAQRLADVEIPQTLESAVEAYLERALASRDLLGALGAAGAGGAALALTLKNAARLFGKTSALAQFLRASAAPITDYGTFLRNLGAADDALDVFRRGPADGGLARFLVGTRAAGVLGKAFLPLTVVTGLADVVTGGGHDGARGWATRGFGVAGVAGAGTLVASSLGLVALGPVGAGIAGVAVLGYGLWTAGSLVHDHWDDITEFGGRAAGWVGDRWDDTTAAVDSATDWAGDRLADAGGALEDMGRSTVSTLSFGVLG